MARHLSDLLGGNPAYAQDPAHGETGRGVVRSAPATFDDEITVTLATFGESFTVPSGQWLATTLPPVGTPCLLIFDDRQDAWAVFPGPPAP